MQASSTYNTSEGGQQQGEGADHEKHWREELRLTNIIKELEGRCKIMQTENHQLEAMVHKYRTEYEVDTAYLKSQVQNERERQMQWKELYFKAHSELAEFERHHKSDRNNNQEKIDWHHPGHRTSEGGCKECEEERQRASLPPTPSSSRSRPPSQSDHAGRSSASQQIFLRDPLHMIDTPQDEQRPPLPHPHLDRPSFTPFPKVYKPPPQMPGHFEAPPRTMFDPMKYFKCHLCGIYYDSEQKLRYHLERHNEQKTPSSSGGTSSATASREDSMEECFPCPECNEPCKTEEDYRRHLLVHIFKCRWCSQTLDTDVNYLSHVKTVHEDSENPYSCFLCDKQFAHISHLTRHVLAHPDERNFCCVECGKHFSRKGHMTRHMSIHSKCRPYTCADCGKTFAHRTHLRRHEIVHSGARPHQCKVCKQSFSRKSSLSRHYFIHTTEKPFVCPVCEKGFNRKGRLRNHLKIHIREGFTQLADYVIERRPISKEFIEKMNLDTPAMHSGETASVIQSAGEAVTMVNLAPVKIEEGGVAKEGAGDSDAESFSSESEEEAEAELSEEIGYCLPPPAGGIKSEPQVTVVSSTNN